MSAPLWGAGREISGDEIRAAAFMLGLSLEQLSLALGVTRRGLNYWLSGDRPIPGWVALVLDLAVDYRTQTGLMPHAQGSWQRRVAAARGDPPWWEAQDPGEVIDQTYRPKDERSDDP